MVITLIHKWVVLYIYSILVMQLTTKVICLEYKQNGKVRFSLTTNGPPIVGQNITFSCLIFNQTKWKMSWSQNSDRSFTSCRSTFCTTDRTLDKKYVFSTNESGIFMSLNFLNSQDAGKWKCSISSKAYLVYDLKERSMIYPPSSCVLTRKENSFHCFSPCIKDDENFTMMWRFQDKTSKAENMINVTSDCDQHETGTKNTTFKNYTGVIKQNQNHYGNFKGEGQLTCTCGIEGYPTTVIESSPLEIYFYDCSISICFAVTFPISFVLIVISYGIIFFRRKRAGCLAFIIQWYCTIIIKVIFDLSILAIVISICLFACVTETLTVTIPLILLPVIYTICCFCFRSHYKNTPIITVCCVKKDKRKVQKPDRQATEDELSEAPVASNLNQTENCAMKVNSSFVKGNSSSEKDTLNDYPLLESEEHLKEEQDQVTKC